MIQPVKLQTLNGTISNDLVTKDVGRNGEATDGSASFGALLSSAQQAIAGDGTPLETLFDKASATYGVPVQLLKAVAKNESGFRADALSKSGAQGIMQLMPRTAKGLGVDNPLDPEQNIMGGAKLLSGLLKTYDGDLKLTLAAYNAGSGNVKKYGGIPPFKETQAYVQKVMATMQGNIQLPDMKDSIASLSGTVVPRPIVSPATASPATGSSLHLSGFSLMSGLNGNLFTPTDSGTTEAPLDTLFTTEDYERFIRILEQLQLQTTKEGNDV